MRTKQLLITAALTAAGISAGSAASHSEAVFSANAVGFVNLTLDEGFNLISNPLVAADNTVSAVLDSLPASSQVYVYNGTTFDTATKQADFLGGGFAGAATDSDISPGAGFWVNIPAGTSEADRQLTFVGEVAQGADSNTSFGSGFSLLGSVVPQEALLEGVDGLEYSAEAGDQVYQYNGAGFDLRTKQAEFLGGNWSGAAAVDPTNNPDNIPLIKVAEGFWINTNREDNSWVRDFDVNEGS